jgi:hypothetical protein
MKNKGDVFEVIDGTGDARKRHFNGFVFVIFFIFLILLLFIFFLVFAFFGAGEEEENVLDESSEVGQNIRYTTVDGKTEKDFSVYPQKGSVAVPWGRLADVASSFAGGRNEFGFGLRPLGETFPAAAPASAFQYLPQRFLGGVCCVRCSDRCGCGIHCSDRRGCGGVLPEFGRTRLSAPRIRP